MEKLLLRDVCTFINGKAHEQYVDENGEYILVTSKFIASDGKLYRRINQRLTPLFTGDLCMVMSDVPKGKALAKCFLVDKDSVYTLNQRIGAFKADNRYLKKYFYYMLNRNRYFLAFDDGDSQTNLRKDDILNCPVICPDKEEQQKVIDILDGVTLLIKQREKQLDDLDELIKSRFMEIFGEKGKNVLLSDYVWFQEGPGVRSCDFTSEGTILLTGSNINDNEFTFAHKSDRFISNELSEGKYAHFMCDKDDILVVSSAIAPEKFDKKVVTVKEDKKYCLNTGIIRFKPNRKVMTIGYFTEFLKTDYFKYQVMAEMRGIAQMHFGPSHLKRMTILLPDSMKKQVEFDNFVEEVSKSKAIIQKALDEAKLLFDCLIQRYFA